MPLFKTVPQGLLLRVYVQPRASYNKIVGIHGEALKIKLTAPPVDGAANAMCLKYLAKFFKLPKSSIDIVAGKTGRNKRILIRLQEGAHPFNEMLRFDRLLNSALKPKKTA